MIIRHFVTFYSPGTFVSESTEKPIPAWDVELAKSMAREITERYGATPYGFRFSTRVRGDEDRDSKKTTESGIYYLRGTVETLAEVKARATDQNRILISLGDLPLPCWMVTLFLISLQRKANEIVLRSIRLSRWLD